MKGDKQRMREEISKLEVERAKLATQLVTSDQSIVAMKGELRSLSQKNEFLNEEKHQLATELYAIRSEKEGLQTNMQVMQQKLECEEESNKEIVTLLKETQEKVVFIMEKIAVKPSLNSSGRFTAKNPGYTSHGHTSQGGHTSHGHTSHEFLKSSHGYASHLATAHSYSSGMHTAINSGSFTHSMNTSRGGSISEGGEPIHHSHSGSHMQVPGNSNENYLSIERNTDQEQEVDQFIEAESRGTSGN
jgi:hypothetical protein